MRPVQVWRRSKPSFPNAVINAMQCNAMHECNVTDDPAEQQSSTIRRSANAKRQIDARKGRKGWEGCTDDYRDHDDTAMVGRPNVMTINVTSIAFGVVRVGWAFARRPVTLMREAPFVTSETKIQARRNHGIVQYMHRNIVDQFEPFTLCRPRALYNAARQGGRTYQKQQSHKQLDNSELKIQIESPSTLGQYIGS